MTEQDTVVSIHQPPLKNGLFVWIRKSDSLDWERCQIHSLGVDGWVNLVRHGEIGPNHSRQLLPKGCWFVCSSQNLRRTKCKSTKIEDDQTGRQPK